MYKNVFLDSQDDIKIALKIWDSIPGKPRGIVQISHGMAEYVARYSAFACFLNDNDYIVVGHDHRGHGDTASSIENLGFFSNKSGWSKVLGDFNKVVDYTKARYPELPHFIFGHSMGSFITRDYIRIHSPKIDGIILSGTGLQNKMLINSASLIAKTESKLKGPKKPSKLLNDLSFGKFNKMFKPNRTEFDWLSRDEEKVDEYITSPYCGFVCTTSMYLDLFHGLKSISNINTLTNCRKDLPILFLSGTKDPVGDYGKGVSQVYKNYISFGFTNVSMELYGDSRHEILNEINRLDVYLDILKWLNTKS